MEVKFPARDKVLQDTHEIKAGLYEVEKKTLQLREQLFQLQWYERLFELKQFEQQIKEASAAIEAMEAHLKPKN